MDLSVINTANCKTSRVMRVILAALSLLLYQCTATSQQQEISALDNYSEQWQQLTDLEREGRIDSASTQAGEIYQLAQQSGNTAQLIKALLHLMKYRNTLEEESFRKNFEQLNTEIESADIPLKQLLYSIRGEMLWQYYEQNRYRFANRTATGNVELDNILTWDLNTIVEETLSSYRASLQDSDTLKTIPLSQLEEIIQANPVTRVLRPALYDFLAHRALDFFSGSERI